MKKILPTLIFYAVALPGIYRLNKWSPSGPCTPGLGILAMLLLFPLSVGLALRRLSFSFSSNRRSNLVRMGIHLVYPVLLLCTAW